MGKSKAKAKKLTGLDALYQAFLFKLSSGERESIEEKGIVQAMPAFKKFLNTLSEAEMAAVVAPEAPVEPETPEEPVKE